MGLIWKDLRAASYSTVGLEVVLSILFGFGGGYWLDGRFGTAPYLMLAGSFCGVVAAFRAAYRAHRRIQRDLVKDDFREARTGRSARYRLDQKEHS